MRSAAFALVVCFSLLLAPTVAAAGPSTQLDAAVGTSAPCSVDATYRWFNYGPAAEAELSITLTPGGTTGHADPNAGPNGSLTHSVSVPAGVDYVVTGRLFNNGGKEIARSVQTFSGTCPA